MHRATLRLSAMLIALAFLQITQIQAFCGATECGDFYEGKHASFSHVADLTEQPWLGRLGYETKQGIVYKCLGVLISSQYLLAPAQCFEEEELLEEPLRHVLLGDWNPTNSYLERDCDKNRCNKNPIIMEIDEIIVHPEFDNRTLWHNLSILKLNSTVSLGHHISPICLLSNNTQHLGQHLPLAGFAVDTSVPYKIKGLALSLGYRLCRRILISYKCIKPDFMAHIDHLCVTSNMPTTLLPGSALINVQVDELESINYYLVGLLLSMPGTDKPHLFVKIQRYYNWIEQNIICSNTTHSKINNITFLH